MGGALLAGERKEKLGLEIGEVAPEVVRQYRKAKRRRTDAHQNLLYATAAAKKKLLVHSYTNLIFWIRFHCLK